MLAFLVLLGNMSQMPSLQAKLCEDGFYHHTVRSEYQAGPTLVRVLLPDKVERNERLPVVYVLPVEAGTEHRYGDGLTEIKKHALHERHRAVFVAPSFTHLPWYADHPTDPSIRQESYLLSVVLPLIEANYPIRNDSSGRHLLGFSKSGWGAFCLLLRHPQVFGKAVAWDAPLMLDLPGKFGSGEIFGTADNFKDYRVSQLLEKRADTLGTDPRLILTGYGSFREDHLKTHELMQRLGIQHVYRDGPHRSHDWQSGWVDEAVSYLLGGAAK